MSKKIFITGTDTNVGKTYISVGLLKAFQQQGLSTVGIKPVASGCFLKDGQYWSDDALELQRASTVQLDYRSINPFAFEPPVSPNIAAISAGQPLNVQLLSEHCHTALTYPADICLIEGVGGWLVPLNAHETMADFVIQHRFDVIVVVGIRLGCINHARLTLQAILKDNLRVIGWIANCVDPEFTHMNETISTLQEQLNAECLAVVGYQGSPGSIHYTLPSAAN
jgi:dethiobiotin synthetase